jgi:cellulose synthase/poly-beta-1,6-N-acetylglucosamine synthase-like glycosyltransferase
MFYWTTVIVLGIAQIITLFFTVYQASITLVGMLRRKRTLDRGGIVGERYALLVCAHNEEAVVGNIVDNLMKLDYPKSLYDVYVIADNCTDDTAKIAREHGAIVLERHDLTKKGKGHGLSWALNQLWLKEIDGVEYDAVAIFDADNLVSPNFLRQVSVKLREGFEVVQVYLDTKNPSDTWVTKAYAFSYWASSRVFQLARENIGLSAQLGGTGMVMTTNILKKYGWNATSLTEDLEFTTLYILREGKRVAWVHDARIYDEKPLKIKASYIQRTRWMKGHFDCASRYFWPLIKAFIKKPRLLYLDAAIYLIQPSKIILALAGLGFWLLSLFSPLPEWAQQWVLNDYVWWCVLSIFYLQPIIGLIMEKKHRHVLWWIQTYVFSFTWIPIIPVAWFKRKDKTWTHTQHTRAITANEINEIVG